MKRIGKGSTVTVIVALVLAVSGFVGWRASYVPEPKHLGIGLGTYLARYETNRLEAYTATRAIGTNAVPYLVQEMQRNVLAEALMKVAPKMPASLRPIFPDPRKYHYRRMAAAHLLSEFPEALPAALAMLEEEEGEGVISYCMMIVGLHALGSAHEERAMKTLVRLTRAPDRDTRKMAVGYLTKFTRWSDEVVPALVSGLYYPGTGPRLIEALVRFGTNALPYLKVAAASEARTNVHVRPASVALERIEQLAAARNQNVVTNLAGKL